MTSELSQLIYELMSKELSDLGPHIVRKQCKDIDINPDDIKKNDLPRVAKVLSEVMVSFGKEEARKIYLAINKLQNLEILRASMDYLSAWANYGCLRYSISDRWKSGDRGARTELIQVLTQAMLFSTFRLRNRFQITDEKIESWIKLLNSDCRMAFDVCLAAQRSIDLLFGHNRKTRMKSSIAVELR